MTVSLFIWASKRLRVWLDLGNVIRLDNGSTKMPVFQSCGSN
jgi:hypothetical protein